jgi:hypothetical protein
VVPGQVFDLDRAIHDALAIWYFPGMWEWPRDIVLPLAMQGFEKAMTKQRAAYAKHGELAPDQESAWESALERGGDLLARYFAWAPAADAFSPVRVEADFDANVPDPQAPGLDLVGPRGPIHYQGRIDALVVDAFDAYWIMDHRVVDGRWEDPQQLLLDERGIGACWAWEIFYYGMKIAGTVYNELRLDMPGPEDPAVPGPAAAAEEPPASSPAPAAGAPGVLPGLRRMYLTAAHVPEERMAVSGAGGFRRTRITRRRSELAACGVQVAAEALDMTSTGLAVYPNPAEEHCGPCAYREPCLALTSGLDPSAILAARYRNRGPEEVEEGRLGGVTWSMNRGARPPRFGS